MLKPALSELLDSAVNTNDTAVYVAIDGHSGSGKSTLASSVLDHYGANNVSIIEGDDFYTGGNATLWDNRSALKNSQVVIDWQRLRTTVHAMKTTGICHWPAFDWSSDRWDSATPPTAPRLKTANEKKINIIEGVYSARAELASLYQLRILITAPEPLRNRRLIARDSAHHSRRWAQRWLAAEQVYFGQTNMSDFNLVIEQTAA